MGEEENSSTRLMRTPKEGERILPSTRRPDGTYRKPVRIRPGYVPPDEVPLYQARGSLPRKGPDPEGPPGYDPSLVGKPKTKLAKRNERKKEKKLQAATGSSADKGKDLDLEQSIKLKTEICSAETMDRLETVGTMINKISNLSVSATSVSSIPSTSPIETSKPEDSGPDIDKRIRALKKKIRLAEAQLKGEQQNTKPEQAEKTAKIEGWRGELKMLEDKKANPHS